MMGYIEMLKLLEKFLDDYPKGCDDNRNGDCTECGYCDNPMLEDIRTELSIVSQIAHNTFHKYKDKMFKGDYNA
jgi:uncharacterized Fe-S cluster-containing MiaB family protein